MSAGREQVEVVKRFFEARKRHDLEGELAEPHEEVVWDMSHSRSPYRGLYKGHHGFRQIRREAFEAWADIRWEPQAFVEIGEHVVVPMRGRNRGRGGIELDWTAASVYTLRDGKIARSELYQSTEEAREAAGLSEQDGGQADSS